MDLLSDFLDLGLLLSDAPLLVLNLQLAIVVLTPCVLKDGVTLVNLSLELLYYLLVAGALLLVAGLQLHSRVHLLTEHGL